VNVHFTPLLPLVGPMITPKVSGILADMLWLLPLVRPPRCWTRIPGEPLATSGQDTNLAAAGDERHPGGRQRRIPGVGGSPADVFHYDQMLRRRTCKRRRWLRIRRRAG
jgi:hypothetical protein